MKALPPPLQEAKDVIFAQDIPRKIRESAWWLFKHELRRIDPYRNKRYTVSRSLTNVLKWINDQKRHRESASKAALTSRQIALMQMLVEGLTQEQMALTMGTKRNSIKANLADVRRRLGVESLYQAVAIVVERGWVRVPPAKE